MNSVDESLKQLILAIRQSKEYEEYHRDIERVKEVPDIMKSLDQFRKQNFEMQNRDDMDLEMIDQMEQEYQGLMDHPIVSAFLASELALCRLMQEINLALAASIDFE
ncbi:MAG: YlbF family regulator [Lachnospiraceae bacterium]|jgi:cell fate (sporulation/competence/biofilm development) regulator YlbF (YheA/YmcA/DUF963 family)|nr:YlbF family regulator [Lachnospiraceae bacterium]